MRGQRCRIRQVMAVSVGLSLVGGLLDPPLTFAANDGGQAEQTLAYGSATDTVFLADLDGDGSDELVIRRGNQFYLDSNHDGGAGEVVLSYGSASDEVFVGDLNGDGQEELIVRRGNQYHIDAAQQESPNQVRGSRANEVTEGVIGAVLAGGGHPMFPNHVTDRFGTIGGGGLNQAGDNAGNTQDSTFATVAGGLTNTASGFSSTVGGGERNTATHYAVVGGGLANTADGNRSTIGGGGFNDTGGQYATVPGGDGNSALGDHSFAAGRNAKALHEGAFVWNDPTRNADFVSTRANQFSIRASGGTRIFSDTNTITGVLLAPGATAWSIASDRNLKENFTPIDKHEILQQVSALPITRWNLKSQDAAITHIGPMAQDFHAAFGVGESERHIGTGDADGIALVSIQALYERQQELTRRLEGQNVQLTQALEEKSATIAQLQTQVETLLDRMARVETKDQ